VNIVSLDIVAEARERGANRLAEAQTVVKMRHSAGPARATPPDGDC